jgi:hypothetical protein
VKSATCGLSCLRNSADSSTFLFSKENWREKHSFNLLNGRVLRNSPQLVYQFFVVKFSPINLEHVLEIVDKLLMEWFRLRDMFLQSSFHLYMATLPFLFFL